MSQRSEGNCVMKKIKTARKKAVKRRPGRPAAHHVNDHGDRRIAMIDAALDLFAYTGVAATSFKSVARAISVTSALVHYYFKSREELIHAVMMERVVPVIREIWQPIERNDIDCQLLITLLGQNTAKAAFTFPWFAPLWLREFSSGTDELYSSVIQALGRGYLERFGKRVRAAQRAGEIHPCFDANLLFSIMVGMALLPAANVQRDPGFDRQRSRIERSCQKHLQRLLTKGVGK